VQVPGVILDCACAPILMGTAGDTSAEPSPLPRTPERADAHGVFRFEPAYRNTLCLAALPRNKPCCAGPVTPSSMRSDRTLPVAHLPPTARAEGRTKL
jgi:hypothetical protein